MTYNLKILDKYITKQLIDTFILGIVVFTTITFASDTFLQLVKQISAYGISLKVAILIVILKLPYVLVLTIPMGILSATILTFNKLSTNSEITIMRACGISIIRLALPVAIIGLIATLLSFTINEFIVPQANVQAKNLTLWALDQKNIPQGRANFSFKEMNRHEQLKRLFYVDSYINGKLQGVTVLDMSRDNTIQIIQSKYGDTTPEYWNFEQGSIYTISNSGNFLNTTVFDKLKLFTSFSLSNSQKRNKAKELNFFELANHIASQKNIKSKELNSLLISLHEKLAIPLTSLLVALIGVPLAITPPRVKFNRGILFSVIIIFCYYIIRAFSISLGEAEVINPVLSAWIPNIIIAILGIMLFYRKNHLT